MKIRLVPNGVEEARFKRIPDGWLFTTPNPWVFGPRLTFVVNAKQKPAIAAGVRRSRYLNMILMLATVPLQLAVFLVAPSLTDSRSSAAWLAIGGFVVVFTIVTRTCEHLIIRPLLHGLPRTSQKIRLNDMLRTQSEAMSVKALSIATLYLALLAAAISYLCVTSWTSIASSRIALFMPLGAVLCTVSAIVFFGMLVTKLRAMTWNTPSRCA
jgi:hypothetical protein